MKIPSSFPHIPCFAVVMFSAGWQSHLCGLNTWVHLFCKALGAAQLADVFKSFQKSCWNTTCCAVKNLGIFHSHSPTVFRVSVCVSLKHPANTSNRGGREAEEISRAVFPWNFPCPLGSCKNVLARWGTSLFHVPRLFKGSAVTLFLLWSGIPIFSHSSLPCLLPHSFPSIPKCH